jgi:hypothetical protein
LNDLKIFGKSTITYQLNKIEKPSLIEKNILNSSQVSMLNTIPHNLNRMNVPEVWNLQYCGESLAGNRTIVGILDTGVDVYHVALRQNYVGYYIDGTREYPSLPDSKFEYVIRNPEKLMDLDGHGTHACGIICGMNQCGAPPFIGIAPEAKWTALNIYDANGNCDFQYILNAILALLNSIKFGQITEEEIPDILNCSVNLDPKSEYKHLYVQALKALHHAGIFPVINNLTSDLREFYGLGILDTKNKLISKHKSQISVPGTEIVSTWPDDQYAKLSGPSLAVPHLTGSLLIVRQILKKKEPYLTNKKII